MGVIKKFRIKSFKKSRPLISLENISLSFGKRKILDKVSFIINRGQILGMLGPNGVGKSTIFNLITGLIKPDHGQIKFEGVDVEHYRTLAEKEEQSKIEIQKKKGEFEQILKDQQAKAADKIQGLTSELTKIKVDGALLNAASTLKAINPDQVVRLVREQIKMDEAGQVEIIDSKTGQTRYSDTGEPLSVDGLVSEFLKSNPHFQQAGMPGAGSTSNTKSATLDGKVDITKLDMNNPEHRKVYADYRKKSGLV